MTPPPPAPRSPAPPGSESTPAASGPGALCPYCGNISARADACDRCRGLFEPLSRQASQNAMGPWYIHDTTNPFRPGCGYATLQGLVARGRVTAWTIIRGPTTHQFWTYARNTPGVAHLTGECHACHATVSPTDPECRHCGVVFENRYDRQFLGLTPVRLLPGHAPAEKVAASAYGKKPDRASSFAPPATSSFPSGAPMGESASESPYGVAPAPVEPMPVPVPRASLPPFPQRTHSDDDIAGSLMAERRRSARSSQRLAIMGMLIGLGLLAVMLLILAALPGTPPTAAPGSGPVPGASRQPTSPPNP